MGHTKDLKVGMGLVGKRKGIFSLCSCVYLCLPVSAGLCLPCLDAEVRRQPRVLVLAFHLETESLVHCCGDQAPWPVSFWTSISYVICEHLGVQTVSSSSQSRLFPSCLSQVFSEALGVLHASVDQSSLHSPTPQACKH